MKNKSLNRDRILHAAYCLCIFLFLAYFFLVHRPLIVDHGDDWTYISFGRSAVPIWNHWNPGKVFPEIFLPLCAQIGITFVMPFCGDYIWSISLVVGIVLSLMITLYIYLFDRLLKRSMKLSAGMMILVSALFFAFHFKSWMSPWIPSRYLFFSTDLNNCFNYLVPALLNIHLMLLLEQSQIADGFCSSENQVGKGFIVLLVYLAIFSNMFSNCILAVHAGMFLLGSMYQLFRRKISLREFLSKNALHIGILVLWCICAVFELNGQRASVVSSGGSLIDNVKTTIWDLLDVIERMDDSVFYMCIAFIAIGIVLLLFSRGKHTLDRGYGLIMLRHLASCVLIALYLILLSAMSHHEYIMRMDVLIGIMVHVLIAAFISAAYIIRRIPRAALALPTLVLIVSFDVQGGMHNFELANTFQTTEHTLAVSRNILGQVLSADEAGMKEVTVIVPKSDAEDNFPYPVYLNTNLYLTLKRQGMLDHIEKIHIEPSETYYTDFGIE